MRKILATITSAGRDFLDDDCMSSAAAMAYYSIFSLPPLLVLVLQLAQMVGITDEQMRAVAQKQLTLSVADSIARPEGAESDGSAASSNRTWQSDGFRMFNRIVGAALLLFAATGLFAQFQVALNRAWGVQTDPQQSGFLRIAVKRIFSLGMVVVIAFLLMVSLVITTLIDEIVAYFQVSEPTAAGMAIGIVLNSLAGLAVATALFAAMFKFLPDVKMAWRDVWGGAFATAVLFVAGKEMIGWYLQQTDFSATWGAAAASILGVLVWIYYTTVIVLFGAELTEAWARDFGQGIAPAAGAIEVLREERKTPETRDRAGMEPPLARA